MAMMVYCEDGRLATVGFGSATLAYTRLAGTDFVAGYRWYTGGSTFLTVDYAYDRYLRLTEIRANGETVAAYTLDGDDRRLTSELADGSVWNYTYDEIGQIAGAVRTGKNAMSYAYDGIGNRLTAEEDGEATEYVANQLNQYTRIGTEEPSYDADGDMLSWNGWSYAWNSEKRLVNAEKGSCRVEADYDYMGRRFEKKVYDGGVLTKHLRFVYDGCKLIAIHDALDGDRQVMTFVWQPEGAGLDVPLAMTWNEAAYFYICDGNKNVIAMTDSSGTRVAEYIYAPFGRILHLEGELAEINPFRFSSEYHDDETSLVYYNYRYYNPTLGRWTKRDPMEESGGINTYTFVSNRPTNLIDLRGLEWIIKRESDKDRAIVTLTNPSMDTFESLQKRVGHDSTGAFGEQGWA